MTKPKQTTKKPNQEEKIWGAISYFWILSLVVLAARKNNEYIRFHANQGFLLFFASLFWWFPILGQVLAIILVIVAIIGIVKSLQGEKWELPVVGGIAAKAGEWFVKTVKL